MNTKRATARYFAFFIPAMLIFLGASVGLAWLEKGEAVSKGVMIGLALIPIVALLSMFWLHWRFLSDIDEYLRQIQIKGLLFAAAIVMTLATGWGYLENFFDVPALPVFWLNPVFWLAYALGVGFQNWRAEAT